MSTSNFHTELSDSSRSNEAILVPAHTVWDPDLTDSLPILDPTLAPSGITTIMDIFESAPDNDSAIREGALEAEVEEQEHAEDWEEAAGIVNRKLAGLKAGSFWLTASGEPSGAPSRPLQGADLPFLLKTRDTVRDIIGSHPEYGTKEVSLNRHRRQRRKERIGAHLNLIEERAINTAMAIIEHTKALHAPSLLSQMLAGVPWPADAVNISNWPEFTGKLHAIHRRNTIIGSFGFLIGDKAKRGGLTSGDANAKGLADTIEKIQVMHRREWDTFTSLSPSGRHDHLNRLFEQQHATDLSFALSFSWFLEDLEAVNRALEILKTTLRAGSLTSPDTGQLVFQSSHSNSSRNTGEGSVLIFR